MVLVRGAAVEKALREALGKVPRADARVTAAIGGVGGALRHGVGESSGYVGGGAVRSAHGTLSALIARRGIVADIAGRIVRYCAGDLVGDAVGSPAGVAARSIFGVAVRLRGASVGGAVGHVARSSVVTVL